MLLLLTPLSNVELVQAQGKEADVFVAQAMLAYEDKQYDQALKALREALEMDPDNLEAQYYLGLVLSAQQKFTEAAAALENAHTKAPEDLAIAYHLGVAYFALERYDQAEPLLTKVFAGQPQTENLGYYVGFMRYRHKDYQGALRAFQTGAVTDPNIRQLTKFYAGLTLAILGLPEQAAGELEEATRIRTVSPLTGPADRLRDTVIASRESGERRLRGEVRIGAFYDTNVAINPLASSDSIAEDLRKRRTNTPGELASVRLDYAWFRSGGWESTLSYSYFQTVNNKVAFYNVQNQFVGLGGSYRGQIAAMPFQIGVQYTYDDTSLRDSHFLSRNSANAYATLVENQMHLTTLQGRFQQKDFTTSFLPLPEDIRDGQNWMAGITHVMRFAGDKHYFRIGYQYDTENSVGPNWSYRGHRALAGFQYTVPWQAIRFKYDYDIYKRTYPIPNSLFPQDAPYSVVQKVVEQNHVVRLEYPLPNDFTFVTDFQGTWSQANLPVFFNYNRKIVTVSLSWSY